MSTRTQRCPHCKRAIRPSNIARHEAICLDNPVTLERLRAFFHNTAHNGYIMPGRDYAEASAKHGLPSIYAVRERFGNWQAVADWCGLDYAAAKLKGRKPHRSTAQKHALNEPVQPIGRDPERVETERRFDGMPAKPVELVRRAWDARAEKWVPVAAETGWCRLW